MFMSSRNRVWCLAPGVSGGRPIGVEPVSLDITFLSLQEAEKRRAAFFTRGLADFPARATVAAGGVGDVIPWAEGAGTATSSCRSSPAVFESTTKWLNTFI